jgi:hypothetical protein
MFNFVHECKATPTICQMSKEKNFILHSGKYGMNALY